jgi:transmembrane sensor
MSLQGRRPPAEPVPDAEELAAQAFMRRCLGQWSDREEFELQLKLEQDPAYADAFRRVERSWGTVGQHATSAELMAMREQAISSARRASARRWLGDTTKRELGLRIAAAVGALAVALTAAYQLAPFGYRPGEYRTHIGEQRVVELEDHSRVALDAATRLRVRYSKDARMVQLLDGQAQFSVAKDPARPFKVAAGDRTVVALGTVFTVEYIDQQISVAMLEGKVAVLAQDDSSSNPVPENATVPSVTTDSGESRGRGATGIIELAAGEALRVQRSGHATFIPKADLEAATAWREGKVIFHEAPLSEAVRRLNRYSYLQIEVTDPALAAMQVSGVFEAGNARAFVTAVEAYLPATVEYSSPDLVTLRAKAR